MTTLTSPQKVYLVGAGPGDPELLTLKALKVLQSADVVLVDDLVSASICALIPSHVRTIYVGKRGGCKSTPQAFIEKLMIHEAQSGLRVVRLKGGDPLIFGRGGEEIESLRAQGIQVEVVNGVTSALAAMSALPQSLTHRELAHGVMFLTGHPKSRAPQAAKTNSEEVQSGQGPEQEQGQNLDWESECKLEWESIGRCARSVKLTLVIYMGISAAQTIQSGLLLAMHPQTPVALIENASLVNERVVFTVLENMFTSLSSESLRSPCVIIVGDVIKGAQAAGSVVVGPCENTQVHITEVQAPKLQANHSKRLKQI
jgi:uroporphyrin-III C-methyltransferase